MQMSTEKLHTEYGGVELKLFSLCGHHILKCKNGMSAEYYL